MTAPISTARRQRSAATSPTPVGRDARGDDAVFELLDLVPLGPVERVFGAERFVSGMC
jgi:hypothetical protein